MTRRTRSFLASRALSSGGWGLGHGLWALVGAGTGAGAGAAIACYVWFLYVGCGLELHAAYKSLSIGAVACETPPQIIFIFIC